MMPFSMSPTVALSALFDILLKIMAELFVSLGIMDRTFLVSMVEAAAEFARGTPNHSFVINPCGSDTLTWGS